MKNIRDFIRSIAPSVFLEKFRSWKKKKVNANLKKQEQAGKGLDLEKLKTQLTNIGIEKGDIVLVHSSLSKMGFVKGGPKTVIQALQEVITKEGTLLMPTSPNNALQLDHVRNSIKFDVLNSPSKLGAITEVFRTSEGVKRSCFPTEPVSAWGNDLDYFLGSHHKDCTPYTENSPFFRVAEANGKILMIGVTLDNAGTNLHILEDMVDEFKYPVYYHKEFEMKIIDEKGDLFLKQIKVHNPEYSQKRKCDELIPMFHKEGVLIKTIIGNAPTLLIDANKMRSVMLKKYREAGVTMYTPQGEKE